MDKQRAEQILEIEPPYTYAELRSAWKKRCQEYHPDRSAATGMDTEAANDVLRDINEAFQFLSKEMNSEDTSSKSEPGGTAAATYAVAVTMMENAATAQEWATAEAVLRSIAGFQDAEALADMCAFSAQVAAKAEARVEASGHKQNKDNAIENDEQDSSLHSCRQNKRYVIDDWDDDHILIAAQDRTTDIEILYEIYELRREIDARIASENAKKGPVVSSGPSDCEEYLALNPNLPTEILLKLLEPSQDTFMDKMRYDSIRKYTFMNAHIPYEIMKEYSTSQYLDDRSMIARNKYLPEDLQKLLSKDCNYEVRETLARNKGISKTVMKILVKDSSPAVRKALASSYDIDNATMMQLARDEEQEVRFRLATNHHTPPEVMRVLVKDRSFKVRHEAKRKARFHRSIAHNKEAKEKWRI